MRVDGNTEGGTGGGGGGIHMLRLVQCMRQDAGLPIAILPLSLSTGRVQRALEAARDERGRWPPHSSTLLQLLGQLERRLFAQAKALLACGAGQAAALQHAAALPQVNRFVHELSAVGLAHVTSAKWTAVLADVLGL